MAGRKKKTEENAEQEILEELTAEESEKKAAGKKETKKEAASESISDPSVKPYESYGEYMDHVFACVNTALDRYIEGMKLIYAAGNGGYKNVLYPDLEVASDVCREKLESFEKRQQNGSEAALPGEEEAALEEDTLGDLDADLLDLLGSFGGSDESESIPEKTKAAVSEGTLEERLKHIGARAEKTVEAGIALPFYSLAKKLDFEPFTLFCFACGVLSSTQTDYAGVFQIVNENGGLSAPTIEAAAKLYFSDKFSITNAYGDMSACLEQLMPILNLEVRQSMPFSTAVSPDKRMIDFLFGRHPLRTDENYDRFFSMLATDEELDPVMANASVLDAMEIAYSEGTRIFYYYGDEGSGRKFFVRNFCEKNGLRAVTINCKKLFEYDFQFVNKALWAVTRECILTNACCCLTDLQYRDEEKEKFFGYMDLAFAKLTEKKITVFAMSKLNISMKEITKEYFAEFELPTPTTTERFECWKYFAQKYTFDDDVDLLEMSTKFVFTAGKIKDALKEARNLSVMDKETQISRKNLFKGCNRQMSSELSQKATRVDAKFGFDDIVMNPSQRETITHAIEQMNFKKQVYEQWNYTKKYPYGRGLTVLLFGAPGTGKSMMAQVLAHELNLELYRVDISKVVDKYVGETEKSLSMIFREAKKCNVVLFFDECDTIFAKRSDDGGSNQASANNKTALLLQEMEAYDGVCVLATNYKHNIDPAFFRRMKYIVEFQFPNADTREMLWRTTIPKTTPLDEDVDIRYLAEKYEFAGGNIKNCILNAAFLAAADPTADGKVCMRHYLNAIKYEFVKVGKVFTKADFEPYAEQVGLA
ncbi:MAG: ATP-binding protein [Lachnospiraceae bacterium]|nr:ATP-binding protein [Lachnospiraceae bacterium]